MNLSFCKYMFYENFNRIIHVTLYAFIDHMYIQDKQILYSVVNTGRVKYPRIVYPRVGKNILGHNIRPDKIS